MQDSSSVITDAAKGIVEKMAEEMEVKPGRMYEILGKDNPYPKAKRLIRVIARIDKERVRSIKADLDAMFCQILGEEDCQIDVAEFYRETSQAVGAILEKKPVREQVKEVREMVAVGQKVIVQLETGDLSLSDVREIYSKGAN